MARLPVHDAEMDKKIQAFDWLINASNLLSQKNKVNVSIDTEKEERTSPEGKPVILKGITYWEKMLSDHQKFLEVLPLLDDHPIIQKIECEIDQAQTVTRFVKE